MPVSTRSCVMQSKIGFQNRKKRTIAKEPSKIDRNSEQSQVENICNIDILGQRLPIGNDRFLSPPKENDPEASPRKTLSPRKRLFTDGPPCSDKENDITKSVTPSKQRRNISQSEKQRKQTKSKLCLSKQEGLQYGKIRQKLHTSQPDRMLCREKETDSIFKFMARHLDDRKTGSLYISGAPGTGKTLCLTKVFETLKQSAKKIFTTVWVNCMSLKQSHNVYYKIANEISKEEIRSKESEKYLESFFVTAGPMIVLVLDEIDQLESKNQEILYKIFEWPSLLNSRLILVGIANALDLTDRILPRLQAKLKCKPELLQFTPYTKNQIAEILDDRLKEVNDGIVDSSTVQFCARKVAAVAGDMRKALDIMRRSIEIVEIETKRQQILKAVTNSPDKDKITTGPQLRKVSVSHVAKVVSEVYSTNMSTGNSSSEESLPLQQKLLICSLLLLLKKERAKETAIGKLHGVYCKISTNRQLSSLNQEEFIAICQLVESRGILSIKQSKDIRTAKVCFRLQESDVHHALQDKTLLCSILENGIPS